MVKDREGLERAYNDAQGVTARFNRNILNVVNEAVGTNFDPARFAHHAFYNEKLQRIELYLVATEDMEVTSPLLEQPIQIRRGEPMHTENSHKFTEAHVREFAEAGRMSVGPVYTDANGWFTVVEYVKSS
jgi:L-histidine N-alpha-methyltransferase